MSVQVHRFDKHISLLSTGGGRGAVHAGDTEGCGNSAYFSLRSALNLKLL